DGLGEVLGAHEPQHGTEALRVVKERAGPHAELDPGRPEKGSVPRRAWLGEPRLALVEDGERPPERGPRRLGQRGDAARQLPPPAPPEARRPRAQLARADPGRR